MESLTKDFLFKFQELELKEMKQLYLKLALVHHPDMFGGDLETMKAVNNAFKLALEKSEEVKKVDGLDIEVDLMEKIQNIIRFEGINIEVLGKWIWVTGDTFSVKNELKKDGFLFARKKIAWFYRLEKDKCGYSRGSKDLNDIRDKYGSRKIKKLNLKLN